MLNLLANTPEYFKSYWLKTLQVKESELSSKVPIEKSYNVSSKEQKKIVAEIRNRMKERHR